MSDAFLDRDQELAQLRAVHHRKGAQLLAVHGRRRIGKTALLVHWLEREPKLRSVYWVADRSTSQVLLGKFSRAIGALLDAHDPRFTFSSWDVALEALSRLSEKKPLVVVIDELPYLMESVPAFATILQAAWDKHLRHSQVRLIVAGSQYHMMQDTFASPKGALFGRTTADLHVDEVGVDDMALFLPSYSPRQLVETYGVVGGVPRYLEMCDHRRPVLRNVREIVLSPATLFRNEPTFLIQDEIADPRTYLALLEAIGGGARRPVDIARDAGVQLAHVGKYLHTLEVLRFVRRIVSAEAAGDTRKSRYEVRDPYLRFHFAFIQPHVGLLEQGRVERVMEVIRVGFDAHVGKVAYEEICRRYVATQADRDQLPFRALEVGRLWDGRIEIDVAGIDHKSKNALVGECRWRERPMGAEVLDGLVTRAKAFEPLRGFKLHYVLFSRSGFTTALQRRAAREGVLLVEGVPSSR